MEYQGYFLFLCGSCIRYLLNARRAFLFSLISLLHCLHSHITLDSLIFSDLLFIDETVTIILVYLLPSCASPERFHTMWLCCIVNQTTQSAGVSSVYAHCNTSNLSRWWLQRRYYQHALLPSTTVYGQPDQAGLTNIILHSFHPSCLWRSCPDYI